MGIKRSCELEGIEEANVTIIKLNNNIVGNSNITKPSHLTS
jgi:hypothetical protein